MIQHPHRPVTAVTFDAGGTLIEPWPSVGHVYAEVAARHGVKNASAELLQARFKAAWDARTNFNDTRADWEKLVDHAFHGLTDEPAGVTFFAELYERFAQPDVWRIYDDVLPTLDALAARVRLGVISNWDERLRILLKRLHLDGYFESIVVSCEAGACKPAAGIFEQAARAFGVPPETILHVGDSFEMDVQGAESAGFQAVQVLRGQTSADSRVIASLRELPRFLV
jgi:putative hydrolase of the HAD superfamily